jgi:hypothetical protein
MARLFDARSVAEVKDRETLGNFQFEGDRDAIRRVRGRFFSIDPPGQTPSTRFTGGEFEDQRTLQARAPAALLPLDSPCDRPGLLE